jgi:ATP-dependent RNA helicase DDX10/DBP4
MLASLEPPSDDDGYVSPDFDLPDLPSEDEDMAPPPSKRNKNEAGFNRRSKNLPSLEDEEELALRLLGRS